MIHRGLLGSQMQLPILRLTQILGVRNQANLWLVVKEAAGYHCL